MSSHIVTVSGVQLNSESSISPDRLRFFSAPNPLQNLTPRMAVELAEPLSAVPYFAGLMLFVAPGTFAAEKLNEDAVELSLFIKEGAGADDPCHIFFLFPKGVHKDLNGGLLAKSFGNGWEAGFRSILLDAFKDGREPIVLLSEVPEIRKQIEQQTRMAFGLFYNAAPEFDPFAQPTGLQILA